MYKQFLVRNNTLTEGFPCFFLGCKANARVILAKTGHGPHSSKIFVLFYVLFVCKCVLPRGDNPIAVNKYIISYQFYSALIQRFQRRPYFLQNSTLDSETSVASLFFLIFSLPIQIDVIFIESTFSGTGKNLLKRGQGCRGV